VTAIGVAGLLVGAGVGIAAKGSSGTKTVTARFTNTTVRAAPAPAHTETHAATHTVTQTVTVTRTAPEPTHTVAAAPSTFSGSGRKQIGTIIVPHKAAIHWHAPGGYFFLGSIPEGAALEVSEKGTSGNTVIAKGEYPHVEVKASGEWGFTLTQEP
jgi:hypothetical protein